MKTCTRCYARLPLGCFNADSTKADGLYPRCKLCRSGASAVVKVTRWRGCRCGKLFRPRNGGRGALTATCSRSCASAAALGRWRTGPVGYSAVHQRLATVREKPGACQRCGAVRFLHWALARGRCANPLAGGQGPYSADLADYDALCVPCHKRMDLDRPRNRSLRPEAV